MNEQPLPPEPDADSAQAVPPPSHPRPSIELHIGELVLDGFDPASRYAIGEAVERELTRLFVERGATTGLRDRAVAELDGGALRMESNASAEEVGARVARAVFGGLL
jgi:hypothetical protein